MTLTLITGPMFSGKSTELVRRMRQAHLQGLQPAVIKCAVDDRYDKADIVTHDGGSLKAVPVNPGDLKMALRAALKDGHRVIGIDEAQFFTRADVVSIEEWSRGPAAFVVAGLSKDFLGWDFHLVEWLAGDCDEHMRLTAVCGCGADAVFTQRIDEHGAPVTKADSVIDVGGHEKYVPACARCFQWSYEPSE